MRNCPNCGSTITCGCQDRIASDGNRVCSSCLANYEQKIKEAALNAANPQSYSSNPNENTPS